MTGLVQRALLVQSDSLFSIRGLFFQIGRVYSVLDETSENRTAIDCTALCFGGLATYEDKPDLLGDDSPL